MTLKEVSTSNRIKLYLNKYFVDLMVAIYILEIMCVVIMTKRRLYIHTSKYFYLKVYVLSIVCFYKVCYLVSYMVDPYILEMTRRR